MKASEIRALPDEPACSHNTKEKSGCARPKPGATAGGCSFDGALVGDDVEAVCKDASARWGTPVVPVDAASFYGTKNLGNRLAGEAMFKHVIGTREPLPAAPRADGLPTYDVNLIGEYNIAGEFWHVAPLFDELAAAATRFVRATSWIWSSASSMQTTMT
ncbi:nitrogenase component 1 [Propionivibrio sp.]|uniref:nitrogenase component 1 n=1 Tax=Propionivibrio sp. TaxID=2212460 RepID=UPI003BF1B8AC